jgi:hypothetical protein
LTIKDEAGSRGRSIYFDGEDLTHRIIGLRVLLIRDIGKICVKGIVTQNVSVLEERSMVDPMDVSGGLFNLIEIMKCHVQRMERE